MNSPLFPLVLYTGWALLHTLVIVSWRTALVVRGQSRANGFPSGIKHGSDRYWRVNRAHANAAENLPVFASIVIAGMLAGIDDPLFGTLALACFCARMAQTIFHVASNSQLIVTLRATSLVVQIALLVRMGVMVIASL